MSIAYDREAIPSHWQSGRVKALASVTLGKMLDAGKAVRPVDAYLPYLRAANVQDSGLDLKVVHSMPFSESEARALDLKAGDVLVVEGGAVGTCVALVADMPGWSFQKTLNRIRCRDEATARFISYVLRSHRDSGVIDIVCNKSTIPHLTAEKLAGMELPIPPESERCAIADFLDRETAQIDTLIAAQRHLVNLLLERRAGVIETEIVNVEPTTSGQRLKHVTLEVRQGWSPQCYPWPADGTETWGVLKAGAANGGVFKPGSTDPLRVRR